MKTNKLKLILLSTLLTSCSTRPMGHKLDPKRAEPKLGEDLNRDIPTTPQVEESKTDSSPDTSESKDSPVDDTRVASESEAPLIAEATPPTIDEGSSVDDGGITSGGFFVPGIRESSELILQEYWDHEGPRYLLDNKRSESLALDLSVWESPARGRSERVNKLEKPIVIPGESLLDWNASAIFPSGCRGIGRCLVHVKKAGEDLLGQIFPPYTPPQAFEGVSTIANVNGRNAYEGRVQTIQTSVSFAGGSKIQLLIRGEKKITAVEFGEDLPIAIDKLSIKEGDAHLSVTLPRVPRAGLVVYSGRICFEVGQDPCSRSDSFQRALWVTP